MTATDSKREAQIKRKARKLTYHRSPTKREFNAIERMFRKTRQGKRHFGGSQINKLIGYLNLSSFDAQCRLASLARHPLPPAELKRETCEIENQVLICGKIGAFLARKVLSAKERPL